MRLWNDLRDLRRFFLGLEARLDRMQKALGRIESRLSSTDPSTNVREHEFQVFSQWGEDGILQFLTQRVEIPHPVFVEFGVENYTESNTRFLLQNNRWSGLILDGDKENIRQVKQDPVCWRYNLTAVHAFVDRENVNALLEENGVRDDIGLLSVDIDGNDYWVWEAIRAVHPRLVVCEYNSLFGWNRKLSIPYDRLFVRSRAHFSNLYYGASLAALEHLGKKKGYALIGCNSAGNNAFFVREDLSGDFRALTSREAFVPAHFREARAESGALSYLDRPAALQLLADLVLQDVETGHLDRISSWDIAHA